ncbi:MAG: hypothetical protein EOP90_03805 [Lysobacteraceae bacterium]|nr:MAG: hypothetical protein EOP90_03805 [Xanthomonadaceae bacterium]
MQCARSATSADAASPDAIERVVTFLRGIGLDIEPGVLDAPCFLPGVCIRRGAIVFDRTRLLAAGDLLHEAAHLAVTPARHRDALDGSVRPDQHHPHGGEPEAIAWSFAAALAIDLPLEELFHARGYNGQAQALALTYAIGVYPGAAGLVEAGMAAATQARCDGVEPYPRMLRWLRE